MPSHASRESPFANWQLPFIAGFVRVMISTPHIVAADVQTPTVPSCNFGRRLADDLALAGLADDLALAGAAEESEGRRLSETAETVSIELNVYTPVGMETAEFLALVTAVPASEWSAAFGVEITGTTLCQRILDENGIFQVQCAAPPPVQPPPPSPVLPPPSSPPSGDEAVPVVVIAVTTVLGALLIVLLLIGVVVLRRRRKRVEGSAVTPEVADRAVVQPPPLPTAAAPAATYADRVPVHPPVATE